MFLVTTAIKQTFDKSNKMLFLGEWCFYMIIKMNIYH